MPPPPQRFPARVRHIAAASLSPTRWKNGRGITHEVAAWPQDPSLASGGFEWRISKALVEEAGPFSAFEGCQRILTVVHGAGMDLTIGAANAQVLPLQPIFFQGDTHTTCRLLDGPVHNFNVVFRPEAFSARVDVIRGPRDHPEPAARRGGAHHVLIYVVTGAVQVTADGQAVAPAAGNSVWLCGAGSGENLGLHLTPDAVVVRVRLTRARHAS